MSCHVLTFILRDCLVGLNLFMVELLGLNLFIVFTTLAPGTRARLVRPGTNTGHRRIGWPPPPQLRHRHQLTSDTGGLVSRCMTSPHLMRQITAPSLGLGLDTGVFTLAWSQCIVLILVLVVDIIGDWSLHCCGVAQISTDRSTQH